MIKLPDYFDNLVEQARPRAEKAMVKFPQPNYVLNKVAEESGEVIKAVIHYTEGRETWANVETELIDNLAMLIRLVKEGDQVIGFTPPAEVQRLNATAQPVSDAACDVLSERQRQVSQEGWTPEHDDTHSSGEMAGAAACYARHVNGRQWVYQSRPDDYSSEEVPESWPWDEAWWKPKSPRKDLVRAAALLIAEIERIDRLAAAPGGQDEQ
ncbi:hypothetical protein [Pantoea ananatis]|uniref:hypothetical protein n=1 Tax=Pantoea ananas TaxID=553 RepID=UPI000AE9624D|nr:hypothetical protein [Pantoea ananatis]